MSFTVADIPGVGFKYQQTAQPKVTPPDTGTIAAVVGAANWGPVKNPVYINGAATQFRSIFSDVSVLADEGHAAMDFHLQKSSLGWFTRLTDGTEVKAFKRVKYFDTPPVAVGGTIAPNNVVLVPGISDTLAITYQDTGVNPYGPTVQNVTFTGSALATKAQIVHNTSLVSFPKTYAAGETVNLVIDGVLHTYTAGSSGSGALANESAWATEIKTGASGNGTVPITLPSGATLTGINGTSITLTSGTYGAASTLSIAAGIAGDAQGVISSGSAQTTQGLNSSHTSIVSQINAAIPGSITTQFPGYVIAAIGTQSPNTNKLILTGPSTGGLASLVIAGNARTVLGLATSATGVTGKTIGTFVAFYPGKDGNTIEVNISGDIAGGNQIDFIFRGNVIGSIVNFNYISGNARSLTVQMNNSSSVAATVVYLHGQDETGTPLIPAVVPTDELPAGTFNLSGGTNGDAAITDPQVILELNKFTNMKIYDIDIIAAPGHTSETVQDALDAICAKRQDCWTPIETPLLADVNSAVQWHNGQGGFGRLNRLNSIYSVPYFPWIKIKKPVYDSNNVKTTVTDNFSPNVRIIGTIAQAHSLYGAKFAVPAGTKRSVIDSVEGLQMFLSDDDEILLYADQYDNCINPIIYTTANGFYINGDKTSQRKDAQGRQTSLSRINVMEIGLYIKKQIQTKATNFYFEPDDKQSWNDFAAMLTGISNYLIEKRAIEEAAPNAPLIICDETTNTPEVTNSNGIVAVFDWTPFKTVERIKVVSTIRERVATVSITSITGG